MFYINFSNTLLFVTVSFFSNITYSKKLKLDIALG